MIGSIQLGEVCVRLERKAVKNVHLSVHPPEGRVTLVAPLGTRLNVARAFAISKLAWIHKQQAALRQQSREPQRRFVERETHYLWGQRHLMRVAEHNSKPTVSVGHKHITLIVRPGCSQETRARIIHDWHKSLLHAAVPKLIDKWEKRLNVKVAGYFLQRMKTKWGSCNPQARHIRLNTELVKKPKDLLEYVVVHEMIHLIEPTHSDRFIAILEQKYPSWREARVELNELPLADEAWRE